MYEMRINLDFMSNIKQKKLIVNLSEMSYLYAKVNHTLLFVVS